MKCLLYAYLAPFLCFGRESLYNAAVAMGTNTLSHFRVYIYLYCEQRGEIMQEKQFQVYYSNHILPLPEHLALEQKNSKGLAVFHC